MNSRACLLAALVTLPAWAQEPAAYAPAPAAPVFDLRSDAVKKIVHDTAVSQSAYVQAPDKPPAEAASKVFVYVPPEKPPAPVSEPTPRLPDPPQKAESGLLAAAFDILLDEITGAEDGVTSSNEMLRCRIQKEQKTSPPGIDNCPTAE